MIEIRYGARFTGYPVSSGIGQVPAFSRRCKLGFYLVGSIAIVIGIVTVVFRRLFTAAALDPNRPTPGFNSPPRNTDPRMFQAKQAVIGAFMIVFGVVIIIYGATH